MSLLSLFESKPRATDWPATLSDLRVELKIEERTERGYDTRDAVYTSIHAVLRHAKGRDIERGDARIEVNGVPLEFHVRTGNYYDRYPYYHLREGSPLTVTPGTVYRFVLIAPDGKRHALGEVTTPAALQMEQIAFPRQRPAHGPVVIAWKDLAEPARLTLFRSDFRREADGNEVHVAGSANDPAALRREIGGGLIRRRSSDWTIAPDFLANRDGLALETLGAEVRVEHSGRMERTLAKESFVQATRLLILRMEFFPPPAAR